MWMTPISNSLSPAVCSILISARRDQNNQVCFFDDHQPLASSNPIAGGRPGLKLLVHVMFAKYGLHLPLNRQSDV